MRYVFLLLSAGFFFVACNSEPTVKLNNVAEFEEEVGRIKSELSKERAERFEQSAQTVMKENIGSALGTLLGGGSKQDAASEFVSSIDGKTVSEVIAMADSINEEKIRDLKEEVENMKEIQEQLDGVVVQSASITFPEGQFIEPDPRPVLSVRNETNNPLKDIELVGEWKSPDRPVPWWEGELFCRPEGGLKTGEERKMECHFMGLGKPEEREKADFTVEVVGIEGPDSSPDLEMDGSVDEKTAELDSLQGLVGK